MHASVQVDIKVPVLLAPVFQNSPTGNSAVHDFTIFLLDTRTYKTFAESSCEEHCTAYCALLGVGTGSELCPPGVTADSN